MDKGKLYLIPSPLGENEPSEVIPMPVLQSLEGFKTFVVEEIRTARRYLSKAGLKGKIVLKSGSKFSVNAKSLLGVVLAKKLNWSDLKIVMDNDYYHEFEKYIAD